MTTPDGDSERVSRIAAIMCLTLLILHALVVVVHGISHYPNGHVRLREAFGACVRYARGAGLHARCWITQKGSQPGPAGGEDHILAALVEAALRAKRQRFMRAVGQGLSILTATLLMSYVVNFALQNPRWATPIQALVVCTVYPVSWYLSLQERDIKVLRVCTFMQFVSMGAFVMSCSPQMETATVSIAVCTCPRIIISLFVMDVWVVYRGNAVCSAMVMTTMIWLEEAPSGQFQRKHIFFSEVTVSVTICVCASAFEGVIKRSCRQALELQSSRNESLAAVGVLKAVCDAVVRLDGEMLVADKETKLAALLLHGPGRVLTGSEFLFYVSTEDQQMLFREWLRAPVEVDNEKGAFMCTLRDSTGNSIHVEMFHVPYEYFPGTLHHFIGIREKGTGNVAADRPLPDNEVSFPAQEGDADLSNTSSIAEGSSDNGPADFCCWPAEDMQIRAVQEIDSKPVFKFDPTIFKVLGYSDGFGIGSYGPPRKGSFMSDRMKKCDVNTKFFRDCSKHVSVLCRRARTTSDPVEVEYASTIVFTPVTSREDFRLSLRIILIARVSADRRPPALLGTAVVQAMCVENWGVGSARHGSAVSGNTGEAQVVGRTSSVSL